MNRNFDPIDWIETNERNSIRSEAAANWGLQQGQVIPKGLMPTPAELARAAARKGQ